MSTINKIFLHAQALFLHQKKFDITEIKTLKNRQNGAEINLKPIDSN